MPEYFTISMILPNSCNKVNLNLIKDTCKDEDFLKNKNFKINRFNDDISEFDEVGISIENLVFDKNIFDTQLNELKIFANKLFKLFKNLKFIVCSYELNGYLLSDVHLIEDFNDEFLAKFPISFSKNDQGSIVCNVNLSAQDIF